MKASLLPLLVSSALVTASCSALMNPYVAPSSIAFRNDPSLTNAFAYAEDQREEYRKAMRDHAIANRSIGVLVAGAATTAAALGIVGGHRDSITGLGVGGAGLYALDGWLYRVQRLRVWAEGERAIGCTLAAFSGVRSLDSNALDESVKTLDATTRGLEEKLARLPGSDAEVLGDRRRVRALNAIALAAAARARWATIVAAAGRLYEAVRAIDASVHAALLEHEPDLAALSGNLNQSLLARAKHLTGAEFASAATTLGTSNKVDAATDALLNEIDTAAGRLERQAAVVDSLLAGVGEPVGNLDDCVVHAEELGLGFRTYPDDLVVIDASAGAATGTLVARGGKPPYHARFVGSAPGADVKLVAPNHDTGAKGEAEVAIQVTDAAISRVYQLLVSDEGAGRAQIAVDVRGKTVAGARASDGTSEGGEQPSESLRKIQQALIDVQCLAAEREVTRADEAHASVSNADGLNGGLTKAAIARFDRERFDGRLEDVAGKQRSADFESKLLRELLQAKTENFACSSQSSSVADGPQSSPPAAGSEAPQPTPAP